MWAGSDCHMGCKCDVSWVCAICACGVRCVSDVLGLRVCANATQRVKNMLYGCVLYVCACVVKVCVGARLLGVYHFEEWYGQCA